jgi:hypothetical protein
LQRGSGFHINHAQLKRSGCCAGRFAVADDAFDQAGALHGQGKRAAHQAAANDAKLLELWFFYFAKQCHGVNLSFGYCVSSIGAIGLITHRIAAEQFVKSTRVLQLFQSASNMRLRRMTC